MLLQKILKKKLKFNKLLFLLLLRVLIIVIFFARRISVGTYLVIREINTPSVITICQH